MLPLATANREPPKANEFYHQDTKAPSFTKSFLGAAHPSPAGEGPGERSSNSEPQTANEIRHEDTKAQSYTKSFL
jgi:hypothetical protein